MDDYDNDSKWDDKEEAGTSVHNKKNNALPLWGNERSMNLNPLILTNIQSSHYFKVNLYELKTYHEVIDEIYYKVSHLEPWEKGSRKTAGQTGMCGGVRGVGAGGIVSTAFCLLYKLFTLKLTRKQVIGLITHPDSPYIRGLGFMYIRYTQPPADLWDWYEPYLDDTEELDVKAGGGQIMMIGNILKNFLCKLEWFSTLFPRIPVPIQQKLEKKMSEKYPPTAQTAAGPAPHTTSAGNSRPRHSPEAEAYSRERNSYSRSQEYGSAPREDRKTQASHRSSSRDRNRDRSPHSRNGHRSSSRDQDRDRDRYRYEERERRRSADRDRRRPGHSSELSREDKHYDRRFAAADKEDRRSKDEERCRDEYKKEKKYRDEYKEDKRRSYTPEKHRSHHKEEKKRSKYRNEEYAQHESEKRKGGDERYKYDDEMNIRRSKYAYD